MYAVKLAAKIARGTVILRALPKYALNRNLQVI